MTDREQLIDGLRRMADFLEANPCVKEPLCELTLNAFVHTREELAGQARLADWEKAWYGDWFALRRSFGPVRLDVNIERELVCRRVAKGTRTIPAQPERTVEDFDWVCDEGSVLEGKETETP